MRFCFKKLNIFSLDDKKGADGSYGAFFGIEL